MHRKTFQYLAILCSVFALAACTTLEDLSFSDIAIPDTLGGEVTIATGNKPDVFSDSKYNPHVVYQNSGIWYTHATGECGSGYRDPGVGDGRA